jgi:hypothetical protein
MTVSRRDFFVGCGLTLAVVLLGHAGYFAVHHADALRPRPKPGAGAWAIVVADDANTTPAEGQIIDGPTLRALKLAGKCRVTVAASKFAAAKGYDAAAKAVSGAALFVLDADGKPVLKPTKLPADEAALRQVLSPLFTDLPPPRPDVKQDVEAAAAAELPVKTDAASGLDYVVVAGHKRMLSAYPSRGLMASSLPAYGDSHVVFPVDQWAGVNRRSLFGSDDWVLDQDGISSCVGNGWAGDLRRTRVLAGMKDVKLSPGFTYSLINGGRDQGAVISDGIAALTNTGTCSYALVGEKPFYARQMPAAAKAEAQRFRVAEAYHAGTWEEVGSALMTGRYCVVFGFQVGSNLQNYDRYGVGGHATGPGNHCVMADGIVKLPDGRWVLDTVNSWGYPWGPWKNGRVYLDRNHLFGGGDQPDVCVIRVAADDPKEPFDPPAYKGAAAAADYALAP